MLTYQKEWPLISVQKKKKKKILIAEEQPDSQLGKNAVL